MEQLDVFGFFNVLIASYFADDRECAHENRDVLADLSVFR